jgi:hypothetical protein
MPTYTTLHQDSTTVFDALGAAKFRIVSSITYVKPGDLPLAPGATLSEVFVHSIIDSTDPKQDKFLRVANIHDLTTIVRGRDNALLASQDTYLSLSFTVEFNDVTTAAAAKLVVQTRVDELIADWIKYTTEFIVPTDFPMPAPEATLVVAAKAAYKTAASNSDKKEAELVTANAASAEAVAAAGRASSTYTAALTASNQCNQLSQNAVSMKAAEDAFRAAMNVFKTGEDGFATQAAAFTAVAAVEPTPSPGLVSAVVTFQGQMAANTAVLTNAGAALTAELQNGKPVLDALVTSIAAQCAAHTAAVTAAATAKATADGTVATTQTAQAQAQAAATTAAAAQAAALAAVLVVCADFDPNA